ncbi:MAG: SDR family oxidoreductase [candidate division KSB1 bacterium]|nr:SDR family oxidoreductase [candidate division KSB1 bacterium]MDZ7273076.1 SDR family oxidoreductase [candidate division KSB1 bacterium]MDZ7285179.1 SDR family oxidoreductase [candidate division KSB1 bacterium]MDZ7298211.1 SDR family oxidoreductase [candidate division KSB1 bacterium]MDZ7306885.1 SDR family oxidoreductase [candidate division KSB1 bacterium]
MSENPHVVADTQPACVIVGATGGIGTALCRRLQQNGTRLLLAGRSQEKLRILAEEVGAHYAVVDATQFEDMESCCARALERFGRLDGVVNCVGSLLLKPAHQTTAAEWHAALAANLTSAFATVRAASRLMLRHGGAVVLISSAAARTGMANHDAVAAVKAGVIGLALSAAATYARFGLRVNVVAPGLVRTPLTARIIGNPDLLKAALALHPLARIGEPEQVASAIAWLLQPEQSWVTGQVLGVDGGLASLRSRMTV